jgi:non-ribosomal peptide synthetase component F/thioesterase domain-containing protein
VTDFEHTKPPLAHSGTTSAPAEEVFVLPASLGQERFWGLDRMKPGNPTWSVPVRFRLQGALNIELVRRAFNEIIRRHEALRTTFSVDDGQPVQVIRPTSGIEVPVTDLRHLAKAERDAEMDRLSFQEARRGFDLSVGPLLRVSLLRVEENEHVLLVTPHHTVADYWSIGLISNELGALYEAYSQGSDPALPDLRVQYGDYSIWQREQAQGQVVQSELAYWKNQLRDLPLLDFPTDNPRGDLPTYEATITSILLPVGLTDAIKEIANREGATFFNTMLSALAMVMYQYTGQEDFGVATQVAGRTNVEMEPLIGLFINNVILRIDLSGDPSFSSLVNRVQDTGLQAIANQNLRFEQLLKELRPKDYPSHHTLFRLNFICQRDPVKPLEFAGIKLTVIPSKCQGALYDLNVFLVLRNEGWRLACEYNTDLFDANTITHLLTNYRTMLENVAQNPHRRLSKFPVSEDTGNLKTMKNGQTAASGLPRAAMSVAGSMPRSLGAAASLLLENSPASSSQVAASETFVMPASVAQKRFWALEEIAPGNPALHMRACVRLTGWFSHADLEKSLQFLVDRHETLRTTFERVNEDLVQVIASSRTISLPITSLEDVGEGDREPKLWQLIRAQASAGLDLVHGPLMSAHLFRLRPQEHVLVIVTHHILVDGWSQNVIQRDLWSIYDALREGQEPWLPPLTIQYGDFVDWQEKWLSSDLAEDDLNFWKKRLSAPLPVLNFPTNRPRRNLMSSKGGMETLLLPEDLIQSLKKLCQSQDVTMFMLMLASFGVLLRSYANQEDILIGSPVANRKPETEPLIGPFAGPVTLRLSLSGNPTVHELLGRVRDVTTDALSHTDLPFEMLLDRLEVRSFHGRNPLSQCYFFYQTAFLQPRELRGLTVTPLPDFALGTHFELQLGLLERREGVRAQLEYNLELFEPSTIKEFLGFYETLLCAFVKNPEQHLLDLPLPVRTTQEIRQDRGSVSKPEYKAPRDPVEVELVQIWQEVFKRPRIGVWDDFFDLGGHSMLAARLLARIEQSLGKELPLASLLDAATIEAQARLVRGDNPIVSVGHSAGGSGDSTEIPFFYLGGDPTFRPLAQHLSALHEFHSLGMQAAFLRELTDPKSLPSVAEHFVRAIRERRPEGPYMLGGWCDHGLLALETAQQLRAQGQEIALLVMLETRRPGRSMEDPGWKRFISRMHLKLHLLKFEYAYLQQLGGAQARNYISGRLERKALRMKESLSKVLGRDERIAASTEKSPVDALYAAATHYRPKPYEGRVVLIRSKERAFGFARDPRLGWGTLLGNDLEICEVPGNHYTFYMEPNVGTLAREITARLHATEERLK